MADKDKHITLEEECKLYSETTDDLIKIVSLIHKAVEDKLELQEKVKRQGDRIKELEEKSQSQEEEKKSNSKSELQRIEILKRLGYGASTEVEESETREEKYKVPSLRFAKISHTPYLEMRTEIDDLAKQIYEKYGITVRLVENIDIKNNPTEKFYILLIDNNGNTTTIDLLKYQENIYNFEVDEEESIKSEVVKLKGAYTTEIINASKKIAKYISLALGYKETFYYQYKFIGWDKVDDEVIFKYDTIYSNSAIRRKGFCGEDWAESIQPTIFDDNDEESKEEKTIRKMVEWNEFYADTFNHKVVADIILCAAVSGIVRQSITYTKETNINMNIVAEKGSGKTTMQHLVLSFFGNPDNLEGTFVDTENATEQIRVERAVVPYIMDERMLKVESNGDKKKATEMLLSIFREYEGKIKSRLGSQYSNSDKHAYGAIISSSVVSILEVINRENRDKETDIPRDLGQYRRFIEINAQRDDLFDSAEDARKAEHISKNIYGYGVRQLVSYMLELLKHTKKIESLLDKGLSIADVFNVIDFFIKKQDVAEETLKLRLMVHFGCNVEAIDDFLKSLENADINIKTDREAFKIFDKIFECCIDELGIRVKSILNDKDKKYDYIYAEMESSFQRFALLIMTGHLLNHSIGIDLEKQIFNMEMDKIADYLVLNLYNKLYDAMVLFSKQRKQEEEISEEQKEQEEQKVRQQRIQGVIDAYDWIKCNESYFYVDGEKDNPEKWVGRIQEDDTGLMKVVFLTNRELKIFNAICGQSKVEDVINYKYSKSKDEREVNKKKCTIIGDDDITELLSICNKMIISVIKKKYSIGKEQQRGIEYTFDIKEIEKARKELQSQGESTDETN